jgi:aspartate aminotransferase-like enzyme
VTRATTPITASVYAECERRLGALLDTGRDVLILQGEAILLLEATARSLGGPGVSALNLVSGPYGQIIGDWLGDGGAAVSQLEVAFDRALDPESVADALEHNPVDIVSVVHAEAATGVVNPLAEIAAAAHVAGAIVVVDAVASVGAEPLLIDEWDLDLVMIGLQKAPGGPTGVCALVINDRGWAQIARNPRAPRASILSLLDWKERWIDAGRRRIPGYAYEHEMRALIGMLDALEGDVGFRRTIARHHRARDGARAGARALGFEPWVVQDRDAAAVATLITPPPGLSVDAVAQAAVPYLDGGVPGRVEPAPGSLAQDAIRISHFGAAARTESVLATLTALGAALSRLGISPGPDPALQRARQALVPRGPADREPAS